MHDPTHPNKPQGSSKNEMNKCGDWSPLNKLSQSGGEEIADCSDDISNGTLPQ
jgi:hypothetical protein